MEELELAPNNCIVIPNMVPPTSPNGGDDIVMVQPPELQDELQGSQGNQQKEGTDEEMSSPPKLHGNRQEREQEQERLERRATPSSAFASGNETSSPPELQDTRRQEREQGELRPTEDASLDEETRPGAVAMPGLFTGRTSPSALSQPQGPSAIDEQSTIMGELAEPSEREAELERQVQELENVQNGAVTGTVIVENSGGADHDQNAASSPSGRRSIIFLIGAAFALLLVVGVIVGVTIILTTNNDKNSPSIDSPVTPTQSPAPTKAPTAAPTACASRDCLAEILLQNEVADAEALQDHSSAQFLALRWLANNDPTVLGLDSTSTVILVQRFVLAVVYFATSAEGGLNVLSFLTASSVCEWKGVYCNGDELVVALLLGKSKHGEAIVLISKFRIDSPVYLPFRFSGVGE
jgi:hypothetical protein